ncbi:MAG: hypothetical protein ACLP1D_18510 [Xanthobacteraceae bacterium]
MRLKIRTKRAQGLGAARARREFVGFQVAIELPDQLSRDLDGATPGDAFRREFVNKPLCMGPAQSVGSYAELAGAVGNDDRAGEQSLTALR